MDHNDETRRQALIRDVTRRLQARTLDEVQVFDDLLSRLEKGAESYGPMHLLDAARANRDWELEAFEELADFQIYRSMARVQRRLRDRAPLHDEVRREIAATVETILLGPGPYASYDPRTIDCSPDEGEG